MKSENLTYGAQKYEEIMEKLMNPLIEFSIGEEADMSSPDMIYEDGDSDHLIASALGMAYCAECGRSAIPGTDYCYSCAPPPPVPPEPPVKPTCEVCGQELQGPKLEIPMTVNSGKKVGFLNVCADCACEHMRWAGGGPPLVAEYFLSADDEINLPLRDPRRPSPVIGRWPGVNHSISDLM